MSTAEERKFAFLGSGDPEIQKAMIDFFIRLGATNRQELSCGCKDVYYFIDETNKINNNFILPEGYIHQLQTYLNIMKNQEEKIPEYVECTKSKNDSFTVGKIYTWPDPLDNNRTIRQITTLDGLLWGFKISTKEAYEAQNTYLRAAEWSIGTYAVALKGNFGVFSFSTNKLPIGKIFTIRHNNNGSRDSIAVKESQYWSYKENLKWFATYEEAVQFSKRLQFEASPTAAVSESPLEICKRKYKKGMLVRSAKEYGEYSGEFIIDVDPSEFTNTGSGVDYFASRGWLYIDGKFADILEEPLTRENKEIHLELERRPQYPITPENAFPVKALRKQLKIVNFQLVHEIKIVEEKLLKKTKSKLFNI